MHLGGGGVFRGELVHHLGHRIDIVIVDVEGFPVHVMEALVEEHLRFAGVGEDEEFMAVLAADGARLGAHRHGLQPHAGEGLQIGHEHLVVGMLAGLAGQVEGIGVLHQELAAAHDAEARADLVAELPLDVIEVARHVLVGLNTLAEDVGDHLLIGGAEEHVAVMPVLDAQHFLAIGVIAAGLAPEIGGLDRRHQHLDGPCPVLLLAHDLLDLAQHAVAHGAARNSCPPPPAESCRSAT